MKDTTYNCPLDGKVCLEGICSEGIDAPPEPPAFENCSDTDGLNYSNKGSVYGQILENSTAETKNDSCSSTSSLMEYYCGNDNLIAQESVVCLEYLNDSVCSLGACIIESNSNSSETTCISLGNSCVVNSSMCSGAVVNYSCSGTQVCCEEVEFIVNSTGNSSFQNNTFVDVDGNSLDVPCVGDSCEDLDTSQISSDCGPGEDCGMIVSFFKGENAPWWIWVIGGVILLGVLIILFFLFKGKLIPKKKPVDNISQTKPLEKPVQTNPSQMNPVQTNPNQQKPIQGDSSQMKPVQANSNSTRMNQQKPLVKSDKTRSFQTNLLNLPQKWLNQQRLFRRNFR